MGPKNQIHFSVFVCQNWMKNGQVMNMTMGSARTKVASGLIYVVYHLSQNIFREARE